jgi:hypothetical protein
MTERRTRWRGCPSGMLSAKSAAALSALTKRVLVDFETGFANSEEDYVEEFAGQQVQPFGIEDEAKKISGTNFIGLEDGAVNREYRAREVFGDEKAVWWRRAVEAYPD